VSSFLKCENVPSGFGINTGLQKDMPKLIRSYRWWAENFFHF